MDHIHFENSSKRMVSETSLIEKLLHVITSLEFWTHLATAVVSFFIGIFIRNRRLEKEREEWKAMADSQLEISKAFKRKYVTAEGDVKRLMRELRNSNQRNQEYRRENNYLFAMLMREGLFRSQDHEHLKKQRLKAIQDLFKNMHK